MQVIKLCHQFLLRGEQFPYFLIRNSVLFSILLEIAIEINGEIEVEFMPIFECLPLFFVVFSSVDIKKQILWLVSDVGYFFIDATVDFYFKVKLIIQSFVETSSSWIQNQTREITHNGGLLLHLTVFIVLRFCSVK